MNWIYRFFTETRYRQWIGALQLLGDCICLRAEGVQPCRMLTWAFLCMSVWISGIVQTVVYIDFFYYYLKSWKNNEKLQLPA